MKRKLLSILLTACMTVSMIPFGSMVSWANEVQENSMDDLKSEPVSVTSSLQVCSSTSASVTVNVGGSNVTWTDAAPFINSDGRTMVPLRAVGDALGLTVSWDNSKKEAVFTDESKTIYFPIGSTTARTSEGSTVTMDTAAVIAGDRTYAPIRYLAEYFGYSVGWDNASKTVSIVNGNEGTTTPTTTAPTTTTDPYDFSSYDWHHGLVAGPYDAERERQAEILVGLLDIYITNYESQTAQAQAMWAIINRYSIPENASSDLPIHSTSIPTDNYGRLLKSLALDVLWRQYAEQHGCTDVGRVLPKEYSNFKIRVGQEACEYKNSSGHTFTLADVTNSPYSS